ncbi:MAG: hypothetical protein DMF40_07280 [Verrucomicrobia bacterium]|nr:MAG: hypothetical protein DMF40_07280 [Verrucomicrobiota bacterium]
MLKPFLTANWRYLAMLNFAVEPEILAPHVPAGTELDFYNDKTYLSVVGFLFYHTIVCGLPIPRHRNFEEVNLRGVVFIRELVPKIAIAVTARVFYGEPYVALPMRSEVEDRDGIVRVKYEWRRGNKWEHLAMTAHGEAQVCAAGSHEEFITEHYWGYTARARRAVAGEGSQNERTSEYRVEHPRWKIWPADSFELKADIATLYGEKFVEPLTAKPVSAFIADGSYVEVQRRTTEPEPGLEFTA